MNSLFEVNELSKSFRQGDKEIVVLDKASFSFAPWRNVAIVGRSGSGKSTLLHLLSAMEAPTTGSVLFNGSILNEPTPQISVVFQRHHLLKEFTALENVVIAGRIAGLSHSKAKQSALELLTSLGLQSRLENPPRALSGGECARVAIARALVARPKCVLADEPTGNLDAATKDEVMSVMLEHIRKYDSTLVLVTHDSSLLSGFDSVCHLEEGKLVQER